MLSLLINLEYSAEPNVASVTATAEHASVGVVTQTDPSCLCNVTNTVKGLLPAIELISLFVKCSSWFDLEVLARVPLATLLVCGDLSP